MQYGCHVAEERTADGTCVTSAVCPTKAYLVVRDTASHTYAKLSMAHVTNSSVSGL